MLETGRWKLPSANLIASSHGRNWAGVAAELRCHSPGELPEMVSDVSVIGVALSGNNRAVIHRRGNGIRQVTRATTGAIWLCPRGVAEDSIRITGPIPEMLHIYLPEHPFAALSDEEAYPILSAEHVRYEAGPQDALISQIGITVMGELMEPTSSGRLLVETAALTLAARLVHSYATVSLPDAARNAPARPLDARRLRRVLAFIEANLEHDFAVADLAFVACLSPFHFTRAFKAATGMSPHRFVGHRRLEHAKALIAAGTRSLADVAQASNFASQSNFTRAFSRVVGVSPGRYRRSIR